MLIARIIVSDHLDLEILYHHDSISLDDVR